MSTETGIKKKRRCCKFLATQNLSRNPWYSNSEWHNTTTEIDPQIAQLGCTKQELLQEFYPATVRLLPPEEYHPPPIPSICPGQCYRCLTHLDIYLTCNTCKRSYCLGCFDYLRSRQAITEKVYHTVVNTPLYDLDKSIVIGTHYKAIHRHIREEHTFGESYSKVTRFLTEFSRSGTYLFQGTTTSRTPNINIVPDKHQRKKLARYFHLIVQVRYPGNYKTRTERYDKSPDSKGAEKAQY